MLSPINAMDGPVHAGPMPDPEVPERPRRRRLTGPMSWPSRASRTRPPSPAARAPSSGPSVSRAALVTRDDGGTEDPLSEPEWDDWVSAGRTRHFLADDPLLDWLERHGRAKGFVPDDGIDGFDLRTDFLTFILERGIAFEESVVGLLARLGSVVRIADGWRDTQDLARAEATFEAMCAGEPLIHQGVLRNPQSRTYGAVDLLIRSDVLECLVPGTLTPEEQQVNAPALGPHRWHYRVVDVKFTTLQLLKDGHAGSDHLKYMAQVWIYNEALGRVQGWTPPASYLLGRRWETSSERGSGCLERLARVDHDRVLRSGTSLAQSVADAVAWIRRMRREGATWDVLPVPSVPELYPHARNTQDQPWHRAKASIAASLAELTLLPGMTPARRRAAHARGLRRWDDPRVSATALGLTGSSAHKCDAVLAANRGDGGSPVLPDRITRVSADWRTPAPLELYVDFETVSDLDDDFSALPEAGGQPLIFQIGCGWYEGDAWRFWQCTADRLVPHSEAAIIDAWVGHIESLLAARGLGAGDLRVMHWSPAETSSLDNAYNSARQRHSGMAWPDVPWFDALGDVVRAEPVTVRGAFGFGLKPIARAMRVAGLIATTWEDGPADGLGAMVGAWWCDAEAARTGVPMTSLPLMSEIGRYNEVDCRAMAEVIGWLRLNRAGQSA